jgi:spore maturation protein CgeB
VKIILAVPGHLKTVPMNDYVFWTLKSMGHEVHRFDFGNRGLKGRLLKRLSRQAFQRSLQQSLLRLLEEVRPDALLAVFGMDLPGELVAAVRQRRVTTICWWLNDPFQLGRSLAQAPYYDYYFTNARGCLPRYREAGVKRVFYLPVGCYPEVHRRLGTPGADYEVAFAGDWSPGREEILCLLARDFRVGIWGPWKKHLDLHSPLQRCLVKDGFFTPEEMTGIFHRAHVVLNIHTWFGKWDFGLNPRVFEACGCGAFQVCDFKEEIPEHYEPGTEIVLYRAIPELKERLAYYLAHPREREEIARQGHRRTHRDHTYRQRLAELLARCGLNS